MSPVPVTPVGDGSEFFAFSVRPTVPGARRCDAAELRGATYYWEAGP
ncbi:hypothetical protein [Streptomyces sp. NRRL B-24720]|nr:hypothetical protein [Streptomyces sp. NRRL B-24720]